MLGEHPSGLGKFPVDFGVRTACIQAVRSR
jgi:hypothetical protein